MGAAVIIGVCMVRDEADVIGTVLGHLLAEGVDRLIVADNLSSDGTRDILESFGDPVTVVDDTEPGYYQSLKMSRLARRAHAEGATWVLPFDADEIWYSPSGTIAEALGRVPAHCSVVAAGGWDHIVPAEHLGYVAFPPFSEYRRQQTQPLAKVCFRARPDVVIDMGNHDVMPRGVRAPVGVLEFRHFQYRSLEQMTRKLRQGKAAYEASDVHPMHGVHWREDGAKTDDQLAAKWADLCATPDLVYDPAPIRVHDTVRPEDAAVCEGCEELVTSDRYEADDDRYSVWHRQCYDR